MMRRMKKMTTMMKTSRKRRKKMIMTRRMRGVEQLEAEYITLLTMRRKVKGLEGVLLLGQSQANKVRE